MTANIRAFSSLVRALPRVAATLGIFLLVAACSESPEGPGSADASVAAAGTGSVTAPADATANAMATQPTRPHACELLTAEEMSQILGKPVTAGETDPFNNQTVCTYTVKGTQSDDSPASARMQVEWGSGQAAARAMGIMTHTEVGVGMSDAALGDGARQVGPALMVVVGDHQVTITSNNVGDQRALARHMLGVAGPRIRSVGQ